MAQQATWRGHTFEALILVTHSPARIFQITLCAHALLRYTGRSQPSSCSAAHAGIAKILRSRSTVLGSGGLPPAVLLLGQVQRYAALGCSLRPSDGGGPRGRDGPPGRSGRRGAKVDQQHGQARARTMLTMGWIAGWPPVWSGSCAGATSSESRRHGSPLHGMDRASQQARIVLRGYLATQHARAHTRTNARKRTRAHTHVYTAQAQSRSCRPPGLPRRCS